LEWNFCGRDEGRVPSGGFLACHLKSVGSNAGAVYLCRVGEKGGKGGERLPGNWVPSGTLTGGSRQRKSIHIILVDGSWKPRKRVEEAQLIQALESGGGVVARGQRRRIGKKYPLVTREEKGL